MRYTGHLDLHRAWERTFRRSGLPLAYSQGFHPQPKINLGSALPLGITSDCEVGDFWLETTLPVSEITAAVEKALPPGIRLTTVEEVDLHAPTLQTQLLAMEYEILLLEPFSGLDERLAQMLSAVSLPRQRRDKAYDLRPLIEALHRLPDDEQGHARLQARLAARAGATGRPEELMAEIGVPVEATRIHRTRLVWAEG